MSSKWTEKQQEVISYDAGNLLVSASAGSGKTSVLIEKIVKLITNKSCHLKNLLVVTFTNAASLEIRQRLTKAIQESENKDLLTELDDLSTSDILTFDGFCIKIIKEFGYEIGQNSNFSVADTSLAGFLQNQALDNIISKHNKNLDSNFVELLDTFFDARKENDFRKGIISLYNFLNSKSDNLAYKKKLFEFFKLDSDNEALAYINNYLLDVKDDFYNEVDKLYVQSTSFDDEKLTNSLSNVLQNIKLLNNDFWQNYNLIKCGLQLTIPSKSSKDVFEISEIKESFKNLKATFIKNINSIFSKEILSLNIEEMQNDAISTQKRLLSLFDLVDEFEQEYTKIKTSMQVLDFIDIEKLANKILSNKNIATALQNRYNWIFIDEYQDTSLLQEDIIDKVTTGNNLFMVGDFKQSIYRFRQAEPKIFINKYNQFKNMQTLGSVIDLKTNFRSSNSILQFNNFVFDKIYKEKIDEFEYKGNADLEFGGAENLNNDDAVKIFVLDSKNASSEGSELDKLNDDIELIKNENIANQLKDSSVYSVKDSQLIQDDIDDISKEAVIVADEIKNMLDKTYFDAKTNSYKKITFNDIAVLSRSKNNVLPKVRQILNKANIPVTTVFDDNLFDNYDMQILLSILKTIQNFKDDNALISTLTNIGGFSFDELSDIRLNYKKDYFYNALLSYQKNNNNEISKKMDKFFEKINYYKNESNYVDIVELILTIVENEDLDTYFAVNDYGKDFDSHLNLLIDNIQSIKNNSLFSFLNFIETFGKTLTFENTIKDAENSVTLCTIHKSKGLEYPVVFLIGAGKNFSTISEKQKLILDNDWGICMPSFDLKRHIKYDNLIQKAFKLKVKSENKKEEKRLLYVALTRPKNYLTIVGSANLEKTNSLDNNFKIFNSTNYLSWILGSLEEHDLQKLKKEKIFTKNLDNKSNDVKCQSKINIIAINENQFDFAINPLELVNCEHLDVNKDEFIEVLNKRFEHNNLAKKNTVTQIMQDNEHYNITDFNYQKTDKQDDADFLLIGTAYHKYMELLDFKYDCDSIKNQIAELKIKGLINKEFSCVVDEEKIIKAIQTITENFGSYAKILKEQQFLAYLPASELVDTNKRNKILVQGVADLIIFRENDIVLIDYKTSRISEKNVKEKYKTQLDIYAKAIENFYNKKVTVKAVYSFHLNKLIFI